MTEQHALIGVKYDDIYAVEVTFQLFKIPWEWYDPEHIYDVIIARKEDVDTGDTTLIDLSEKDYFAEIAHLLNNGLPHCHEPVVDILIDEMRQILKMHTLLVEIPPIPWGYSYIITPTHDVDITSVRERRWISVGNAVYQCLLKRQVIDAFQIFGAKCGIGTDPWNCFTKWMRLEEELGVRSTWFFLPEKGKVGVGAPAIRAGHYDLDPELIGTLTAGGWEVGVHGLDNWCETAAAKEELKRVCDLTGADVGTRVHWLFFDEASWKRLDEVGYAYDSTFGYNDDIGFRAGTMQPYRPRGCGHLVEVPLIIQDGGLFGGKTWNSSDGGCRGACLHLSEEEGMERARQILEWARIYGGVVTLLWHQVSLAPPKKWGGFYQALIEWAKSDGAWVIPICDAVKWFTARSDVVLHTDRTPGGEGIRIHVSGNRPISLIPEMRIRIHTDAKNIGVINGDYVDEGTGCVDLQCSSPEILVTMHKKTMHERTVHESIAD